MIVKMTKNKTCPNCGETKPLNGFPITHSPFTTDGHANICGTCLNQEIVESNGNWDHMNRLCMWLDIPWIPEHFTRVYATSPENAATLYFKLVSAGEYERLTWGEYEERWKKLITEGEIKKIHPVFNQDEINELTAKWGEGYSVEEMYKLEHMYQGLKTTYGFSDVIAEDNATKLAKLSHEIDRSIAGGATGIDKLVNAYNKVQESAGFTVDNMHDLNSFESFSEVALFYEKRGWTKKFHTNESKDIVDLTMRDIQAYSRRLWEGEPSMSDTIEANLERRKRLEEQESMYLDGDIDAWNNRDDEFLKDKSVPDAFFDTSDEPVEDFLAGDDYD